MSAASLLANARARLTADGARPVRYLIAGGLNTLFGLSIFPLIRWAVPFLHAHYQIALLVAQVISLCFAYGSYKLTVFGHGGGGVAREMGTFSSFYLLAAAVNWIALPLTVEHLRLPPNVAQTGLSVLAMVGGYFWHSRLTYRPTGMF